MDELFGVKTSLSLATGELIEGWHYADTPVGYYIALDPDGTFIRFVPSGAWQGAGYDHNSPKALFRPHQYDELLETYEALRTELRTPLDLALSRLDINHLRRLSMRLSNIRDELQYDRRIRDRDEARLPLVLDARETYGALLDEIARSGVQDTLLEQRNRIREVVSEFTLPQIDAYYIHPSEVNYMIQLTKEKDELSETNLGKTLLQKLSPDVLVTPQEPNNESKESPDEKREQKAHRLRSAAAWLKVSSGGGLAAANLTLGAVAGVVSALPTLGLGTVAAVVGIATSTYTGLNAASDALKDMASNLERKSDKLQ